MDRTSLGLLILRVTAGGLMLIHGWQKLIGFGAGWGSFPNPIGVGSHVSQILAVFAEFFCSLAVILGIKTRLAAIPLLITMLVAAFIVLRGSPIGQRELPLLYAAGFAALSLLGGGRYALKS
jgi:putative oxidoreductase